MQQNRHSGDCHPDIGANCQDRPGRSGSGHAPSRGTSASTHFTLIEVAVATEDALGVPLPDEDLERFQTVGDIIDYVQRAKVAA